jgi:iron complex transport system permease protein
MAVLVGSGLALAGALMQGGLANPLADPALVGVSAGAALGAVAAASVGIAFGTLPAGIAATIGAAIAVMIVVAASLHDSRPEVVTLLLAGVAVAAFAGALLAVIVSLSPDAAVRSLTFWSSGSLALSTWSGVLSVAPFVLAGAALAASVARPLDVLSLGDRGAASAGVDVRGVRYRALAAVVLLVGAGVGAVGVIAFVGLMIPHAVRAVIGPRHAPVLLVSALAGSLLVLAADTLARLVANPVEIPIGAITAVIGAPAFFVLLRRTRARQGGWA